MKYSITIPAYKAVYFQECLESILSQTYDDYEVVILNDCSPENIKEIVEECQKQKNGDKIRYYENEQNVGAIDVVDNWNKLLELAKGEYVVCMGDDDKLHPQFLEMYNTLIEKSPGLDIYHARTFIIDETSNITNVQEDRSDWESDYSIVWHLWMGHRMQFIGDYLFRRTALLKHGGYYNLPMARGSDWITAVIMAKEKGIANGHIPVFYYRSSNDTITSLTKGEVLVDADIKFRNWFLVFLQEKPTNQLNMIYRDILIPVILNNLIKVNTKTISRDIGFSYMKRWFFWVRNHKQYGISRTHYFRITFLSCLYLIKKLTGISTRDIV